MDRAKRRRSTTKIKLAIWKKITEVLKEDTKSRFQRQPTYDSPKRTAGLVRNYLCNEGKPRGNLSRCYSAPVRMVRNERRLVETTHDEIRDYWVWNGSE